MDLHSLIVIIEQSIMVKSKLTQFIKAYCGIANLEVYKDGKWVKNSDVKPEDCECRLDNIEKYFKGDVSELKGIINDSLKVCVLFVVSGKDGRCRNIYNGHFARTTNSRNFEKDVNDAKASQLVCRMLRPHLVNWLSIMLLQLTWINHLRKHLIYHLEIQQILCT